MTLQHIQKAVERFEKECLRQKGNGTIRYVYDEQDFEKMKSVISSEISLAVQSTLKEVREKVEELGHQQDADTIWCNMDEVLSALDTIEKQIK